MHTSTLLRRKLIISRNSLENFQTLITNAEDNGWKVIPESLCISQGGAIYAAFVEKDTDE
jgi:hypothetical protein